MLTFTVRQKILNIENHINKLKLKYLVTWYSVAGYLVKLWYSGLDLI